MIHGQNRIGQELISGNGTKLTAYSPQQLSELSGEFDAATAEQADAALAKAAEAFVAYRQVSAEKKADFLEAIGQEIMALGDELIERAMAESALPQARLVGERGRTVGQLNLFASVLREGSWVEAIIDTALPNREPLPRADLRKMLLPVGPVVVFTASNFPLAFSTAGGDTASALAAGNPVIVKAHESHLGTNQLVADAIAKAAEKTGMPDGVFSSLAGNGFELGQTLVKHPMTKSVAFTGSFRGGKALFDLANQREEPIPVFSEMGSINPVFLLEDKLASEAAALAKTYAGSITLGVGQFCTNPGLLIAKQSDALTVFTETLADAIKEIAPATMLNGGIAKAFEAGTSKALGQSGVITLGQSATEKTEGQGQPVVAKVDAKTFVANPELAHEIFGPFSLLVVCESDEEMAAVVAALSGQLTCTFMASAQDFETYATLIEATTQICGRVIFNGVPTGVEVCYAMHHGGPFPASTDGRFTSVGADAIKRFVRPVCFQDAPQAILPAELRDDNPSYIWRKLNGELSKDKI